MIEVKIKENDVSVLVEESDDFLFECTVGVIALAGAVAEKEGISQSVALNSLLVCAMSMDSKSEKRKTIIRMPNPKGGNRNAND